MIATDGEEHSADVHGDRGPDSKGAASSSASEMDGTVGEDKAVHVVDARRSRSLGHQRTGAGTREFNLKERVVGEEEYAPWPHCNGGEKGIDIMVLRHSTSDALPT